MWTPAPTGFITIAATRSEETAAVGVIPKKMMRMGVIKAPPPMPVSPTVNPTMTDARTINQSMCIYALLWNTGPVGIRGQERTWTFDGRTPPKVPCCVGPFAGRHLHDEDLLAQA